MKDLIIGFLIGIILMFVICGSAVNRLDKERAKNGFMEIDGVSYSIERIDCEVKR